MHRLTFNENPLLCHITPLLYGYFETNSVTWKNNGILFLQLGMAKRAGTPHLGPSRLSPLKMRRPELNLVIESKISPRPV